MLKKRVEKKITLEAFFKDVFVCEENSQRPYIEIFVQAPENVSQQKLGTIGGILEITDYTEDSSYIVNYLISVIKKEYYSKTKRGIIESFEAALHKTNLALAKLAEHGNIGWIGKINAVVFAIEKNNIHLSKTGTACAFMQRQKTFTDICESPEDPVIPNPLKTFTDVLSGRIEKNDRLIFSTDSLFQFFPFEEIKKNAIKFNFEDFFRFLKTALSNELPRAAVLMSEIREITEEIVHTSSAPQKVNAWSQSSFGKSVPGKHSPAKGEEKNIIAEAEKSDIVREIQSEMEKSAGDFVDKKTGHIYIKEETYPTVKKSRLGNFFENFAFRFSLLKDKFLILLRRLGRSLISLLPFRYVEKQEETAIGVNIENLETTETGVESEKGGVSAARKIFNGFWNILVFIASIFFRFGRFIAVAAAKFIGKFQKTSANSSEIARLQPSTTLRGVIASEVFPSFRRIGAIFGGLNKRQKIYAITAIILILVAPYFIAKIGKNGNSGQEAAVPVANLTPYALPVESEINAVAIKDKGISQTYDGNFFQIINLKGGFFAIGRNNIADLGNKTGFDVPPDFGQIQTAAGMNDLNLIFVANSQNKIASWSPLTKKFQENNLNLPPGVKITAMDCYLTYLYVLDADAGAIYRMPRAEGGFGNYTSWFRDSLNLGWAKDISINENIYLAGGNNIMKFFKNRRQDFSVESGKIELSAAKIYARGENIYVLDADNARIIKYGVDGKILAQYWGQELKTATGFSVDETAGLIYFSNPNGIQSFQI